MFDDRNLNPPAQIREACDLRTLAAIVNGAHDCVCAAPRRILEDAKRAGDALLRAKAQCQHGQWLPWLAANVKCSERTARRYMTVAANWSKSVTVTDLTLRDALEALAEDKPAEQTEAQECYGTLKGLFVPLALDPAKSYIGVGRYEPPNANYATKILPGVEPGSEVCLELDQHPDHPGFWAYSFHYEIRSDSSGWSLWSFRPRRLQVSDLPDLFRRHGFLPVEWTQTPARSKEEIDAVRWTEEEIDRSPTEGRQRVIDLLYPPPEESATLTPVAAFDGEDFGPYGQKY
jgi:hypothetical protein